MREQRTDLKSFDGEMLSKLMDLRSQMYCGGANKLFFYELFNIINQKDYKPSPIWERMENNDIILGEVWTQLIGYYRYQNTVHKYEYLYILPKDGIIIGEHGHEQILERSCGTQQIRKIKEWYIFPNGEMSLCRKGCTHHLVHHGKPMYLISLKIWNHSKWKSGME